MDEVREFVRRHYAHAARSATVSGLQGCCGQATVCCPPGGNPAEEVHGRDGLPVTGGWGCGNPVALAELEQGEVVLDLGSGAGIDVLASARRVGPSGKVYGLDMTEEMLALARRNQRHVGIANAEFLKGHIEEVPLPDESIDVVLSNCVINLSAEKPVVFAEAFRVLRPGARLAIADIIAREELDTERRSDLLEWSRCLTGALTTDQYRAALSRAGWHKVSIEESHAVAEGFASVFVRAIKPG